MSRVVRRGVGTMAAAVMLGVLVLGAMAGVAATAASAPSSCDAPAGDPAPGTAAWIERDLQNVACSTGRMQDELTNIAQGIAFASETPGIFLNQTLSQLKELDRPRITLGQLVPGGSTADPFRVIDRWNGVRGRVQPIVFTATDGARLRGHLWEPLAPCASGAPCPQSPSGVPRRSGPYPAVVITTGSIQGYEQLYYWAAEGLAEAGYMVLTYDVQGQGASETLPHPCAATCPGVPFQQAYNFIQGTTDALDLLFATPDHQVRGAFNPAWTDLDRAHVGLAGHSLGASAVSQVAQTDPRVSAVVAWDNLASQPANVHLRTPALGINSEYFLNPEPTLTAPDPHAKDGAFRQLETAGVDTMQVALRSSTHLEYSYIPYILPASSVGERAAFYYTLAWFDLYLKGATDPGMALSAVTRLTATHFDTSSDVHSIGAGKGVGTTNVPYTIAGLPVADHVSFYYSSGYSLGGGSLRCTDMRHGC